MLAISLKLTSARRLLQTPGLPLFPGTPSRFTASRTLSEASFQSTALTFSRILLSSNASRKSERTPGGVASATSIANQYPTIVARHRERGIQIASPSRPCPRVGAARWRGQFPNHLRQGLRRSCCNFNSTVDERKTCAGGYAGHSPIIIRRTQHPSLLMVYRPIIVIDQKCRLTIVLIGPYRKFIPDAVALHPGLRSLKLFRPLF